jgi:hypothetical protein
MPQFVVRFCFCARDGERVVSSLAVLHASTEGKGGFCRSLPSRFVVGLMRRAVLKRAVGCRDPEDEEAWYLGR